MFSTFTQGFSFQICTLRFSAHTPIVFSFHQTGYTGDPFGDAVFNLLLDLPPVDRVFLSAILVRYACTQNGTPACFLRPHSFVAHFLAVALASKPDVAGALRTQHNPASQCLRRSSVSRIGDAAAREVASCEQSFFGKRSTDGAIVAKRRSVRFTCSTSRKPGVRHAVHRQE